MKYIAIIDTDEKPVSCEFIGCNGNVAPYSLGATTNIVEYSDEISNILAEIKAKIEDERTFQRVMEEYDTAKGLRMALEIIDKLQGR